MILWYNLLVLFTYLYSKPVSVNSIHLKYEIYEFISLFSESKGGSRRRAIGDMPAPSRGQIFYNKLVYYYRQIYRTIYIISNVPTPRKVDLGHPFARDYQTEALLNILFFFLNISIRFDIKFILLNNLYVNS